MSPYVDIVNMLCNRASWKAHNIAMPSLESSQADNTLSHRLEIMNLP